MSWCVGSVFPASNLLTGPATAQQLGPLLLDGNEPPECLFDTGCKYSYGNQTQDDPQHQVEGVLGQCKDAFFPEDLLIENLQEDASLNTAATQSCCYLIGNRLEGIKNRDGMVQLFFPVGENIDGVGSCLFSLESSKTWSSRKSLATEKDTEEPCSLPFLLHQPILQVTADKVESCDIKEHGNVPLAVRTLYQVHWLGNEVEDGFSSFTSKGKETFLHGTSHVAWNPHLPGEAAIILENGDLSIFDLKGKGSHVESSSFKMEECIAMHCHKHILGNKRKRREERGRRVGSLDVTHMKKWWGCEYTWHPRNLLVGGEAEICLIDCRQRLDSKQNRFRVASTSCSSALLSYCNQRKRVDHFTALTRADYNGMFQFVAASTNHLYLYDVRQPKHALLQWEHKMHVEPPRLLQTYSNSHLFPNLLNTSGTPLTAGRIVIASAFQSGEIHAFCYGPHLQENDSKLERLQFQRSMDDVGLTDQFFAWDLPIKLTNGKAHHLKNLEHEFEVHRNNLHYLLPKHHETEQLAGLLNFPRDQDSCFSMLQLKTSGFLVCQNIQASERLACTKREQSSQPIAPTKANSGVFAKKSKTKHYRMEHLPSFLNYMNSGLASSQSKQSANSANHYNGASRNVVHRNGYAKANCQEYPIASLPNSQPTDLKMDSKNERMMDHSMPATEQRGKDPNWTSGSNEGFFFKLDKELCPAATLLFKETGDMDLQLEELELITGFKDAFQQWQHEFEPYVTFCKSSDSAGR